jgi:uncharacterized membrane protein YdjX (TVP38/TMEM64 family)
MASIRNRRNRWLKLVLTFLGFIVISLGLGYLIRYFLARYHIPLNIPTWKALLLVFGILTVINLSVLPLPFGISIMLVAAAIWNPILVTLSGSLGATLGEFSGYFFGYLGKRISIDENTPGYKMVHGWLVKYGMWAITLLSFQPIIPFEIGGFIAGAVKMPINRFLPAIWIGKFPKYLMLIYLGNTLMHHIPFLR